MSHSLVAPRGSWHIYIYIYVYIYKLVCWEGWFEDHEDKTGKGWLTRSQVIDHYKDEELASKLIIAAIGRGDSIPHPELPDDADAVLYKVMVGKTETDKSNQTKLRDLTMQSEVGKSEAGLLLGSFGKAPSGAGSSQGIFIMYIFWCFNLHF